VFEATPEVALRSDLDKIDEYTEPSEAEKKALVEKEK